MQNYWQFNGIQGVIMLHIIFSIKGLCFIFALCMIALKIYLKKGEYIKNVYLGIVFKIKHPNEPIPEEIVTVLKRFQESPSTINVLQGANTFLTLSKKGANWLQNLMLIALISVIIVGVAYLYFKS